MVNFFNFYLIYFKETLKKENKLIDEQKQILNDKIQKL